MRIVLFNFSPFRVSPTKGILNVQESMVLTITFEHSKVGEVKRELHLLLETGEKLTTTLYGSAENACIRLEKSSVVHDDTYIGMKRCKNVRLYNNSSNVVAFTWKKHKNFEEDLSVIER